MGEDSESGQEVDIAGLHAGAGRQGKGPEYLVPDGSGIIIGYVSRFSAVVRAGRTGKESRGGEQCSVR